MNHSLPCHLLYGLGRWAAGCLPLALGPAFTQGAPTICIIATPARTTDKQASWLETAGHGTSTTMTCNSVRVARLRQHVQSFQSVITVLRNVLTIRTSAGPRGLQIKGDSEPVSLIIVRGEREKTSWFIQTSQHWSFPFNWRIDNWLQSIPFAQRTPQKKNDHFNWPSFDLCWHVGWKKKGKISHQKEETGKET